MPLPSLMGHEEANAPSPHAQESPLPDNTPLEFRVILSACRVFLGMEEPAKLEALLQMEPDGSGRSLNPTGMKRCCYLDVLQSIIKFDDFKL
jgi:hypothetical protein